MNKKFLTIGMVVGAFVTIAPLTNSQPIKNAMYCLAYPDRENATEINNPINENTFAFNDTKICQGGYCPVTWNRHINSTFIVNGRIKKQPDWHCDNYSNEYINNYLSDCQIKAKDLLSRGLSFCAQKYSLTDADNLSRCQEWQDKHYQYKINQCELIANNLRNKKRCYYDTPLNKSTNNK